MYNLNILVINPRSGLVMSFVAHSLENFVS